MNHSTQHINFLDTVIYITSNHRLHTKAYTKPTDRQAYLHYNSSHPKHVKTSLSHIAKRCAFVELITTDNEILVGQLEKLKQVFIKKGYDANSTDTEF